MQGMSWMTSEEYITIKWAIKWAIMYAITWAHEAWVKLMQLGTNTISATWSPLDVINNKDITKPEVKPCKHKYYY